MSATSATQAVRSYVGKRVNTLQQAYLDPRQGSHPAAKRDLAQFRRIAPDALPDPASWDLLFEDLPESLQGRGSGLSLGETTIQTTLSLFALHIQGHRTEPAHDPDVPLGRAVKRLALVRGEDGTLNESVRIRFQQFVSAQNQLMRITHLRALISLLKSAKIPLSYTHLATDLFRIELAPRPDGQLPADTVRLQWMRDFSYSSPKTESKGN